LFQPTQVCHVQTDLVSDGSRLLDLSGLAVDRIESDAFGGRVVHVVTADETASACPGCGVLSVSLKGRACTRPRDIPYGTRGLRLVWHKRRPSVVGRSIAGRGPFARSKCTLRSYAQQPRRTAAGVKRSLLDDDEDRRTIDRRGRAPLDTEGSLCPVVTL